MKVFLFIVDLLIPFIMLAAGYFMHKHPPKSINYVVGYRTARSMRSMDAWMFAQKKTGLLWQKVGAASLIASALIQIPFLFLSVDAFSVCSIVLMFVQLAMLLLTIPPIERALKKEFPDGK